MEISDTSRESLLPGFLYSRSSGAGSPSSPVGIAAVSQSPSPASFMIQAPIEREKIRMFSPGYYAA
ncbi:hypothetical protein HPP92_005604 [Vanilla planifolia]|uniref:Uncharacterized protein n=1 Tax=Vanilla planifolia TaxID=51239 RepID=A0A835RUC7_VANPL|nr:hypothetical protein HPP92_005604 [Vanilla planifolia]